MAMEGSPPPKMFLGKLPMSGGRSGAVESELDRASGGKGELDGTSGAKGELDGTSVGQGELDRTSGGPGELQRNNSWGRSGSADFRRHLGCAEPRGRSGSAEGVLDGTSGGQGELDGTSGGNGEWRGASSTSRSVSQSIRSSSMSSSPSCLIHSPSATMQGAELFSTLSLSATFSHVADTVAGSRTLTDVSGSGSASILSTVAPSGDGSSVVAGSGSTSAVGSGMRSAQRGDGGLGEPRAASKEPRERQTKISCGRRRRSSIFFFGPSICHGRVAGRTRETRGKVNNGI